MVNPICAVDGERVFCVGRLLADFDVMYLASVSETWLPLFVAGVALAAFAGSVVVGYLLTGGFK